jgi:hypothetical protein
MFEKIVRIRDGDVQLLSVDGNSPLDLWSPENKGCVNQIRITIFTPRRHAYCQHTWL